MGLLHRAAMRAALSTIYCTWATEVSIQPWWSMQLVETGRELTAGADCGTKSRNSVNQLGDCVLGRTHECPNRAKTLQYERLVLRLLNVCSAWAPGELGRGPAHQRVRGNIRQVRRQGREGGAENECPLSKGRERGGSSGRLPRRGGRGSDRERGRMGQNGAGRSFLCASCGRAQT